MAKVKQKIASIVTAVSVMGTLLGGFPTVQAQAATISGPTAVDVTLEDASEFGENLQSAKNASNYGLTEKTKDGTILHAWCWSFNTIKENLHDIAEAGFTTVQTSPANECLVGDNGGMSIWSENGQGKWEYHYQPTDWKIGNYQLGSRDDFKAMCEEADKYGVKIIVDVLPNHTTPQLGQVSQSLKDAAGGQDKLYHAEGFNPISRWEERYYCTNGAVLGLPDVNTENPGFQKYYLNYLNDLIDCGVDGFRYDTAKHIGLPDDPQDSKTQQYGWKNNFWPVALGNESVDGVSLHNKDNMFIYGEVLQSSGSRDDAYGKIINLTASGYGYTLRSAIGSKNFSTGNISNWGNAAGASKLVTWVESHDTYCNAGESVSLSDWDIKMCWAIIAARKDGTPLFFNRPDGSTNNLGGRWGNNKIGEKGNNLFKDPEVVAVNKFRNAMVGESEYLRNPNGNQQILQIDRGKKGTVIINLGGATSINNDTTMADGTYKDQVSGRTFTVSGGKISGQLDAGKIAAIYNAEEIVTGPSVSVSPAGGSFKGESTSITLNVSNATSATYTTSEGASGSFTNGTTISIGSKTAVGETVTVTLNATGEEGKTATQTYTFTKKDGTVKKNTVYFNKPSGWGTPKIYAYSEDGTTATKYTGEWPGTAMTDEGDGVYSYTFDSSISSAKVIFTDGTNQDPASQQPGFDYVSGKAYEYTSGSFKEIEITTPVENGTVTVNYVDESGNEISTATTMTGLVGSAYTTTAKTISGYTLKTTPSNASGSYSKTAITVTYVYTKNSDGTKGTVIIKYVDDETGEEIEASTTITGNIGTSYTTTAKTINGYTLSFIPSNASGTYKAENISVTYRYISDGEIVTKPIVNNFTASTLNATSGTKVTLSASATGTGTLQYKFLVKDDKGNWYKLRDYSTSNSYVWTTGVAGNKTLYVDVKDSNGNVTRKEMSYTVKESLPVINSFTANKTNVESGEKVTLTVNASGGTGTLQYKFLIKDSKGNWYKLRDYSTSKTFTWTTGASGSKTLYVDVKDSKGKVVRKEMSYTVKQGKVQDNSSSITYTGAWSVSSNANHSGGTCKYIAKTGSATYKFTGKGIKLIAATGTDKGLAKITIDGNDIYYVDLYSATNMRAKEVFMKEGLKSGEHTIKVEWTGLKFGNATNSVITLDAFEVIQ